MGKKKQPSYRLVVSEKTRDTQAGSHELLGFYDPIRQPKVIEFKKERILYWISKGAQASNTVNNLLIKQGIIEGKKRKSVALSTARKAKLAKKAEAKAVAATPAESAA